MDINTLQDWVNRGQKAQQAVDAVMADLQPPVSVALEVELPPELNDLAKQYVEECGGDIHRLAACAIGRFLSQTKPAS